MTVYDEHQTDLKLKEALGTSEFPMSDTLTKRYLLSLSPDGPIALRVLS